MLQLWHREKFLFNEFLLIKYLFKYNVSVNAKQSYLIFIDPSGSMKIRRTLEGFSLEGGQRANVEAFGRVKTLLAKLGKNSFAYGLVEIVNFILLKNKNFEIVTNSIMKALA